jgi:fructose-1,6-bisphosphatase/inositol monophosphatase family enzyme
MTEKEIEHYFNFALSIVKQAGALVRQAWDAPKQITFKDTVDLVTKTDKEVEDLLISSIKKQFPSHMFIGEESVSDGKAQEILTNAPTWLIDPIDGTTNFVHKFPHSCISVGFALNKKILLGIVYNPIQEHLYTAISGKGAYCNGMRISVSKTDKLSHCLVATGFPYDRSQTDKILSILRTVLLNVRDVRRAGSAALDICYVAHGIFDVYYEFGIHSWDVAAGMVILEEAGGLVDYIEAKSGAGGGFDICGRQILVTNLLIHEPVKNLIRYFKSSKLLCDRIGNLIL